MNLVLLGPPGAGKGTQAERLSETFGFFHLSSGDVLRAERKRGSALGKRVAGYMDAGELVPDEIIMEVILEQVRSSPESAGFLLDGFPRTRTQAERLEEALTGEGRRTRGALSLEVPDEEIVERITGRRICPTCRRVYHVKYQPPAKPGQCDADGASLDHRSDDTVEVVEQRLRAYHEQTEPLKTFYRERDLLFEVDGSREMEAVFEGCSRIVRGLMNEAGA